MSSNSGKGAKKWYSRQLSPRELERFIDEAGKGKENKKAFIGIVASGAAEKIRALCGKDVTKIMLESEGIRHSIQKAGHNLYEGDLLHIVDAINAASDIRLSDTAHQNNECLEIDSDIGGKITFVVEVRAKYGGWLAPVTCYRIKK